MKFVGTTRFINCVNKIKYTCFLYRFLNFYLMIELEASNLIFAISYTSITEQLASHMDLRLRAD